MSSVRTVRRFTVNEYERLGGTGILREDERVELIAGEIIAMTPIGSRHAACVDRLNAWFSARATQWALVRVQSPIRLSPYSEPQPDLTLLRPRADFYAAQHPESTDVLLLIEVADSSLDYDRRTKLPMYAQAGIAEVWIVNLDEGRVEAHWQPEAGEYRAGKIVSREGSLTPIGLPGLSVPVAAMLG